MKPEIIVRLKGEHSPKPVEFEELFKIKSDIISMTLLWDTNSYLVNMERRYILINGGRKIAISNFKGCKDLAFCYRRRSRKEMSFGSAPVSGEVQVSYLLGFEGTVKGEKAYTLIHVSPDGTQWIWKNQL